MTCRNLLSTLSIAPGMEEQCRSSASLESPAELLFFNTRSD